MEQLIRNYREMDWETAAGYPAGTQIKVLREHDGKKTFVLQLPPGFHMEEHSHICDEQHLVFEGSYTVAEMEYEAGAYCFIPAHTNHGPFRSENGAVILVIWDSMNSRSNW